MNNTVETGASVDEPIYRVPSTIDLGLRSNLLQGLFTGTGASVAAIIGAVIHNDAGAAIVYGFTGGLGALLVSGVLMMLRTKELVVTQSQLNIRMKAARLLCFSLLFVSAACFAVGLLPAKLIGEFWKTNALVLGMSICVIAALVGEIWKTYRRASPYELPPGDFPDQSHPRS